MAKPKTDTPSDTPPWEGKQNANGKGRWKKLLPWIIGGGVVAIIAWGLRPKPIDVEVEPIKRGPLTVRVSEEGKTRIRNRYIVATPVAGRMQRVPFKAGDEVRANETVITMIEPAQAPILDPRAREQAEAVVSMREAGRKQAAESLEVARASLDLAERDRDRIRSVKREGGVAQTDRDRAENQAIVQSAQVRAAEFALQIAESQLTEAKAALERPQGSTGELVKVTSPVSGRVLKVIQESETIVTPGMEIMEVGDPRDLEIEAEMLSRDAVAMKEGDSVLIEQWGGNTPLQARVRRIEPAAFTKVSALGVEEQRVYVLSDLIDPPAHAQSLGDRYRVEVRVAIWHSDDVMLIPAGALFRQGNDWKTFVLENGMAKLTTVDAGHSDGRHTEILSGLTPGTEVLVHPPDTVKADSKVQKRK